MSYRDVPHEIGKQPQQQTTTLEEGGGIILHTADDGHAGGTE
jgi:hypothetical protein